MTRKSFLLPNGIEITLDRRRRPTMPLRHWAGVADRMASIELNF
jgi:hypothetical protein